MNTHQLPHDVWGVHALSPRQQHRQTAAHTHGLDRVQGYKQAITT